MSVTITAQKTNFINFNATHGPSGAQLATDAPVDNGGNGSSFSPTDLLATAYLSCMLTIIDLTAKNLGIKSFESSGKIRKFMCASPRKIERLEVQVVLPKTLLDYKVKVEEAAINCPVALSVSSTIETQVSFSYVDSTN